MNLHKAITAGLMQRTVSNANKITPCEACGVAWIDHLGISGTCAQLQIANATTATLRQTVADLQADCMMHEKEIHNLQFDLGNAKHERNVAVRNLQKSAKLLVHKNEAANAFMEQVRKLQRELAESREELASVKKRLSCVCEDQFSM